MRFFISLFVCFFVSICSSKATSPTSTPSEWDKLGQTIAKLLNEQSTDILMLFGKG